MAEVLDDLFLDLRTKSGLLNKKTALEKKQVFESSSIFEQILHYTWTRFQRGERALRELKIAGKGEVQHKSVINESMHTNPNKPRYRRHGKYDKGLF